MKKKTLYLTLSILFAIMAVACVAVLIICANAMLSNGATSIRIWGTIAVGVGFLICCALLGVMYALYSHEKNPNIIVISNIFSINGLNKPKTQSF